MTPLKPLHDTAKLIPYEKFFIQAFHHSGDLIDEQSTTDNNPLFQLVTGTNSTPHTTQEPINT